MLIRKLIMTIRMMERSKLQTMPMENIKDILQIDVEGFYRPVELKSNGINNVEDAYEYP